MKIGNATGRGNFRSLIGAAVTLLSAAAAGAQETTNAPTRLPEVVVSAEAEGTPVYLPERTQVGSRLELPPREQVNVIQTVPRALIQDRAAFTVAEGLETVAGVRPVSPAYTASSGGIRSRGFEAYDTFVNGIRLGAFGHPLETANIERMEVLKGPAGIQYGLTEPGGTLNIVTKRPVAAPLAAVRGTAGSFDFYRGELDLGGAMPGTDERLLTRFNTSYEHDGGFRDFDETEKVFFAPALSWLITPRTSLSVEFNYLREEFRFNRGLPPQPFILDLPREFSFMEPNLPLSENHSYSTFYALEHQFGDGRWKARQNFGYFRIDGESYSINQGVGDIDAAGNKTRNYSRGFGEDTYWTLQHEVIGEFETGKLEHRALLGFEIASTDFGYGFREPADAPLQPPPLNVYNPVYGGYTIPSDDQLVPSYPPEHYGNDIYAVYTDYQLKPWEKLKLLAGARLDWTQGFYEPLDSGDSYAAADNFGFSPRAGFVFTPVKPLDLFFNYSTGFSPNLFSDAAGNVFDDPEESRQFEGGIRYDVVPEKLRATAAVFSIAKQNVQVPDPADPTGTRSVLNGEQSSDGFELELAGNILPEWQVTLGYAYVDARITEDSDPAQIGTPLVDAPMHHVAAWTKYKFSETAVRGLWLGYGISYVDERRSSFANASFNLPDYVRHDLAIGYEREKWSAQLNFNNLSDERIYFTHGNNIHLQTPFHVRGTLALRF